MLKILAAIMVVGLATGAAAAGGDMSEVDLKTFLYIAGLLISLGVVYGKLCSTDKSHGRRFDSIDDLLTDIFGRLSTVENQQAFEKGRDVGKAEARLETPLPKKRG